MTRSLATPCPQYRCTMGRGPVTPGSPQPCTQTQPHSPISGQHCREAFLQILDEILGNLQRREMSPGFGRPPSDDLSVPLLCPGARTLLDVAGIHTEC